MGLCSVDECTGVSIARMLCSKHLHRFYKKQPLDKKSCFEKTDMEKFLENVSKSEKNDCWMWTGPRRGMKRNEYGFIWLQGKRYSAHRVSWKLHYGPIPSRIKNVDTRGVCVLHKCDNTLCVNPDHLFIGSHIDNMKDKIDKRRHAAHKQTHCKRGHEFSEKNTYLSRSNERHCRMCSQIRKKKRREWFKKNCELNGYRCKCGNPKIYYSFKCTACKGI